MSVPWHGEPGLESVPAVEPTLVRLIVIFILKLMLPLWTVPFHVPLTLLAAWAGVASARVARMASGRMRGAGHARPDTRYFSAAGAAR